MYVLAGLLMSTSPRKSMRTLAAPRNLRNRSASVPLRYVPLEDFEELNCQAKVSDFTGTFFVAAICLFQDFKRGSVY